MNVQGRFSSLTAIENGPPAPSLPSLLYQAAPGDPGFVGRTAELRALRDFLIEATDRGAALVVSGQAGTGKSALLEAAVQAARADGMRVLRCAGIRGSNPPDLSGLLQTIWPVLANRADPTYPAVQTGPSAPTNPAVLTDPAVPVGQAPPTDAAVPTDPADLDALFSVLVDGAPAPGDGHSWPAFAVLDVLAAVSRAGQPLLVAVDDWDALDEPSRQVLTFVARRAQGSPLALLMTSRPHRTLPSPLTGLPTLPLGPLSPAESALLLASRRPGLGAETVRELLATAAGNPLALMELPVPSEDTVPGMPASSDRLASAMAPGAAGLPAGTRDLLLVAALYPEGDLTLLLSAASRIGGTALDFAALDPAERAGLVTFDGTRPYFGHPTMAGAIVHGTDPHRCRAAHAALAAVLPPGSVRMLWHRSQAVEGPDPELAARLEAVDGDALELCEPRMAVRLLRRASDLYEDPADQGRCALRAAQLAQLLGLERMARTMAHRALRHPLGPLGTLCAEALTRIGPTDAQPPTSPLTTGTLPPTAPASSAPASSASTASGSTASGSTASGSTASAASASTSSAPSSAPPDRATPVPTTLGSAAPVPTTLGSATPVPTTLGSATPVPTTLGSATPIPTDPTHWPTPIGAVEQENALELARIIAPVLVGDDERCEALVAFLDRMPDRADDSRWLHAMAMVRPLDRAGTVLANIPADRHLTDLPVRDIERLGQSAMYAGDPVRAMDLFRQAERRRFHAQPEQLPWALLRQGLAHLGMGSWAQAEYAFRRCVKLADSAYRQDHHAAAARLLRDVVRATRTGTPPGPRSARDLAAARRSMSTIESVLAVYTAWALVEGGDSASALPSLTSLLTDPHTRSIALFAVVAFAEAAKAEQASPEALAMLDGLETELGAQCPPAVALRFTVARAVLADEHDAQAMFKRAFAEDLSRWPFLEAPLRLAEGRWLRLRWQFADAQATLRQAAAAFTMLGAEARAPRIAAELRASGERADGAAPGASRPTAARELLTARELRIAELAARGLSNREIGEQLGLAPRTIGAYLYRIFPRLGVTSRAQLAETLRDLKDPHTP
ncbi:helix-turn-helix transcriptional regulator [Streptomyces justiciae]|uniref:helix-turn-helix transcriptional regulator n=1 Tax=Streptomyces justiciae TaxID=2780140 RepID=UPI00211870FB|nr:AAA family ATPase [Streptomyces justiciae]MCW8383867.1 AAA family ATPase [Streptomyces justiciae]